MNIRIEELKELANTLAAAVDSSDVTNTSECVELKTADSKLYLIISGSDYYVKAELTVFTDEELHAAVNASTLLKLISKTTATAVEFKIEDRFLIMKGNGTYKLPLIYDGDEMLTIPTPPAMEDICTTKFNYNTLESVSVYNSKELAKAKVIINPIQKLYLVDANGCVTFTTGACINSFDTGLDRPVFFSSKVVNLFKLFKGNDSVNFILGKTGEQLKYKFESNNVSLTCVHPAGDISSYPVASIRGMANEDNYENKVTLNRTELLNIVDRLEIINGVIQPMKLTFSTNNKLTISSSSGGQEEIDFQSDEPVDYELSIDVIDLKLSIDKFSGSDMTLMFGNEQAVVVKRGKIAFIIPEVVS